MNVTEAARRDGYRALGYRSPLTWLIGERIVPLAMYALIAVQAAIVLAIAFGWVGWSL